MAPLSDTDPPSKEAATVTRQPFILGSFRIALALGASGPAWLMTFASPVTVMLVAGGSLPFTIVSTAAAPGSGAFIAARGWGDGATSDVTGAAVGRKAKIVNGSAMEAGAGGTAGTALTRAFRNGHMRLGRAGAISPGLEGTATINDGTEAVAGGRAEATSGSGAASARAAANGKVGGTT